MNLYEEIRGNAGVSDVYLEEGIVFFKNSSKLKRLLKSLSKKHEKLVKKSDMSNAKALSVLITELTKVTVKFESVEQKYKDVKGKDEKKNVKAEYTALEKEFKKLIDVARKDSTKKALIAVGGLAVVVGILAAGIFGLQSLQTSGVLDNAVENVGARVNKTQLKNMSDAAVLDTAGSNSQSGSIMGTVEATAVRGATNVALDNAIKATNKDLVQAATVTGATAGGILSVGIINKLRKIGQKNKTIAATVAAIEDLKSTEKKESRADDNEGDES